MTLGRLRAAALGWLAVTMVPGGSALDDDSEPLFVIHNGRRVPTVIIPPARSRPAVPPGGALEVVPPALALEAPVADPDEPDVAELPSDEVDHSRTDRPRRRYAIGYYAGYPVSVPLAGRYGGYYPYLPPDYGRVLEDVYRAQRRITELERQRRFNVRDMRQRKARVLASHEKALSLGLEHLKRGDYAQAVVALQMAADLNHGDPACRIHLAQARLAQGHYEEAGQVLRRALQLQPKLAYVSLDLPSYCRSPDEFDRQVDGLAQWVKDHRAGPETHFLLGYMEFQRERLDRAYAAFQAAARGLPKDSLTATYLTITKPAAR